MDKDTITYLLSGEETAIKEIKLLSSIFSKQVDKELKNYFEIVKKEMEFDFRLSYRHRHI